jgi:hypothetical protein
MAPKKRPARKRNIEANGNLRRSSLCTRKGIRLWIPAPLP